MAPIALSQAFWRPWDMWGKSVSESLEPGETWIGSWEGVGLYEGNDKIPTYQTTTVHLTTHRLLVVPDPTPDGSQPYASSSKAPPSMRTNLSHVRQTEFYVGFMRSSAKITMFMGLPPTNGQPVSIVSEEQSSWTCGVCGFVNPLNSGQQSNPGTKCGLCGVGYTPSARLPIPASGSATPVMPSASPPPPAPPDPGGQIACPVCTFLNHPTLSFCEICSSPLPQKTKSRPETPAAPRTTTTLSNGEQGQEIVRLSFRKGGEKEAYRRLKNVLSDKAWERQAPGTSRRVQGDGPMEAPSADRSTSPRVGGIDGIMQSMNLESKAKDDHMQDAFKDLEVLMVRAGEMVQLAQSLNARLTAQQASSSGSVSEEDATLIRSSLVQLGLPAPALTQDMVRDERRYHEGLAKELGHILTGTETASGSQIGKGEGKSGLMVGKKGRGVIALDEVWGLWMRARGVALLPPATLVGILSYLPLHTSPPIHALTFPSKLRVIHTPAFSPETLLSRILARMTPETFPDDGTSVPALNEEKSFSLLEIASNEGLPIGLTKELMECIEVLQVPEGLKGEVFGLARDDQADQAFGGTRWYRDIISSWEL